METRLGRSPFEKKFGKSPDRHSVKLELPVILPKRRRRKGDEKVGPRLHL